MCASCGCGQPHDDHGDKRNLTLKHLEDAAKSAGTEVKQVVENLRKAVAGQG